MASQKLLLFIGLTFNIAISVFSIKNKSCPEVLDGIYYETPSEQRLPKNLIAPKHYNIELIFNAVEDTFFFTGKCDGIFEILRPTKSISLHIDNLHLNKSATILTRQYDKMVYKPQKFTYCYKTHILVLDFNDELTTGYYSLHTIYYAANNNGFNNNGFRINHYTNNDGNITWVYTTRSKPTGARKVFPCWDEPALRATFNISIKHSYNYTALSNMPVKKEWYDVDGKWTNFSTTPLIPTYLVGLVISNLKYFTNNKQNIKIWCRSDVIENMVFAIKIAEYITYFLEWYINKQMQPKIDLIAIPNYYYMSFKDDYAWGLMLYREEDMLYDESTNSVETKRLVALAVAKKIVYQWFGCVVSPSWWIHDWLNEAFAVFFQFYALDKVFPDWQMMDVFASEYQHISLDSDNKYSHLPESYDIYKAAYASALSHRGPYMMRMLQYLLTEKKFKTAVNTYLKQYEFRSASPDEFWQVSQRMLENSSFPDIKYNLIDVMRSWVTGNHFPVVVVSRNNWPNNTSEILLTQKNFLIKNETAKWWIPISITTNFQCNFSKTSPDFWLAPQNKSGLTIKIDPYNWINLRKIGYYRVLYDTDNWQELIRHLKSNNYREIDVINRAQILDDAYHFLTSGELHPNIFLKLIEYLWQEQNLIAWKSITKFLFFLSDCLKYPDCAYLKSHILYIFDGLLKNIGYKEHRNDSDMKRLTVRFAMKWACEFGHAKCLRIAKDNLIHHLRKPKTHEIMPEWKDWIYCTGLKTASNKIWQQIYNKYKETKNREFLLYLTCTEQNDDLLLFMEDLSKQDSDEYIKHIHENIFISIIQTHAWKRDFLHKFFLKLDYIIPKTMSKINVLHIIIGSIYSMHKLLQIKEAVPNITRISIKDMNKTNWLIERRQEEIKEYLVQFERIFKPEDYRTLDNIDIIFYNFYK